MKLVAILRIFGATALLASAVAVQAGSDRWIMNTSVPDMQARNMVHVRLADASGMPIESDGLKVIAVRDGGCGQGAALAVVKDYRLGFYPEGKAIGLFMMADAWQGRQLCFDLPGQGAVSARIPDGSAGQSLLLTLIPEARLAVAP